MIIYWTKPTNEKPTNDMFLLGKSNKWDVFKYVSHVYRNWSMQYILTNWRKMVSVRKRKSMRGGVSTDTHGFNLRAWWGKTMTNRDKENKIRYLEIRTHQFLSHWLLYFFARLWSMFLAQIENHMGFYTRPSATIHEHNNLSMHRSIGWYVLHAPIPI